MPDFAVSTVFTAKDGVSAAFGKMGKQAGFFGDKADKAFRKASRSGSRFGDIVKGILVTDVIRGGFRQLQRGMAEVSTEFISYDAAITAASAKFKGLDLATQSGIDTLNELKIVAREVGGTTEFTATQAAGGLEFLAMAGFSAKQSMALLPGVVDLATASDLDLARATDIVTDSLGAFGLVVEDNAQLTKNMARVNDVFAKTATTANTSVEALFGAVGKGASQFKATGQSLVTFSALAGVMANSTLKAEESGTVLRNIMLRLSNPVTKAAEIMKDLGVEVADSKGNFNDVVDILGDFEKGLKKYTPVQRAAALSTVFGARSVNGINILLEKGTKGLKAYRKELDNSAGASDKMAETIRKSLGNRLAGLRSAAIELGFKFVDVFDGKIGPAIDRLTAIVRGIDVAGIVAGFNTFLDVLVKFKPIIVGITAAFLTYNGVFAAFAIASKIQTFLAFASALKAVGVAQGLLNIVMMANPIGAVAVAVGLLVAGLVLLYDNWTTVVDAFKSGFGVFDAIAGFFGDSDAEIKKTVNIERREAPNAAKVAAQQVQFSGRLDINGAPEGSTVSGETIGAPPVRMALAGVNP